MNLVTVVRTSLACFTLCLVVAAATLSACGSGSSTGRDAGDGMADAGSETPVCDPAQFRVRGTLDGTGVDQQLVVAGQMLVNDPGDQGCYLNLYFEGGGRLRLEWAAALPEGQASAASGSVNLAAQGGINVGDCDDDGPASTITLLAGGVAFELHELRQAPYCTGDPVSGELRGCAGFK